MRLSGKVAIISGGARGMGAAEAKLFAKEGAKVVIGDILENEGRALASEVNNANGEAIFSRLDVTKDADWEQAVEAALNRFGKLNVLINNAGISGSDLLGDLSREAWDQVMEVNATGVFLGTTFAIPAMCDSGGGSIVNISSQMAIVAGRFTHPAYSASKGAVRSLTKAIAIQYARDNIRCNSVHPGPIETPMNALRRQDPLVLQYLTSSPLERMGRPEEVASGVLYLASDESSFVTGAELVIDGGWVIQ